MRKIVKQNKKAFTLVEVMTAIAIIVLISGLFVSLIVAVKDSFYHTYNRNDAADYADLYAEAIETYILADIGKHNVGTHTYYIDPTKDFSFYHDTETLKLTQMKSGDKLKWNIYLDGKYDKTTGVLSYQMYFVDNYYDPDRPLVMTYEGSVWIPCHTNDENAHAAADVTVPALSGVSSPWNGYNGELSGNATHKIVVVVK